MRSLIVFTILGLSGCLVKLEADPVVERQVDPPLRQDMTIDAMVDAAPPECSIALPEEVRRDDVPVGEIARIIVPLGCPGGLAVDALGLDAVEPPDAIRLDTEPGQLDTIALIYTPRAIGERASAVLFVQSEKGDFAVPIGASSRWTDAACRPWRVFGEGTEIEGRAIVRLDALPPPGVAPTAATVQWSVIEQPLNAVGAFVESFHFVDPEQDIPDDPATPGAWYPLTEPGIYELECTIKPPAGRDCPPQITRLRVQRCPCPDDLSVTLTWRALDDSETPANLDLHLLHPAAQAWSAPGLDCHPGDLDPRWTSTEPLERPTHTGDDGLTPGYEQVTLSRAEGIDSIDGPYRVGVVNDAERTVEVTIRIFLTDRMVWTTTRRLGPSQRFWDVAAIGWVQGMLVALPFDRALEDETPDPWAPLPAGSACVPDQPPACESECQRNEEAFIGRCQ
jgi:hypothetical protein